MDLGPIKAPVLRFVPIADIPPFKRRQLAYTGRMTH